MKVYSDVNVALGEQNDPVVVLFAEPNFGREHTITMPLRRNVLFLKEMISIQIAIPSQYFVLKLNGDRINDGRTKYYYFIGLFL